MPQKALGQHPGFHPRTGNLSRLPPQLLWLLGSFSPSFLELPLVKEVLLPNEEGSFPDPGHVNRCMCFFKNFQVDPRRGKNSQVSKSKKSFYKICPCSRREPATGLTWDMHLLVSLPHSVQFPPKPGSIDLGETGSLLPASFALRILIYFQIS